MKVLVTHDGSKDAENALKYSTMKVRENGGGNIALYIFRDIPDSNCSNQAKGLSLEAGFSCSPERSRHVGLDVLVGKGDPRTEILGYAIAEKIDLIVSVPSCTALLHGSSVPVSTVPATILVPMDNRPMPDSVITHITGEALPSCSKVLLMGIVPIHLYNPSEEAELDEVKEATMRVMDQAASKLGSKGVQVEEMLRMGYPDEEIIKAAEECGVSLVVIPCAADRSSELNKAASIILDEIKQVNIPILYVPV